MMVIGSSPKYRLFFADFAATVDTLAHCQRRAKALFAPADPSGFRLDVEPRDPSVKPRPRRRIALQYARVMPRNDVFAGWRELLDRVVAVEHLAHIVSDGKHAPPFDVGIE